jgi:hypothetical protein
MQSRQLKRLGIGNCAMAHSHRKEGRNTIAISTIERSRGTRNLAGQPPGYALEWEIAEVKQNSTLVSQGNVQPPFVYVSLMVKEMRKMNKAPLCRGAPPHKFGLRPLSKVAPRLFQPF